jgi:hypothetical protein
LLLKIKENSLNRHLIFISWAHEKIIICCTPNTFFMDIFTAVEAFSHISISVLLMAHSTKPTFFGAFVFAVHLLKVDC